MTKPQDNELNNIIDNLHAHGIQCFCDDEEGGLTRAEAKAQLQALFAQAVKRAEIEALLEEFRKIEMLTHPSLPNSGSVTTNVQAWIKDRTAQIAALTDTKDTA